MKGLYYPYSENKGADQLRGYRKADLHLCLHICKKPVFSQRGSTIEEIFLLITIPCLCIILLSFTAVKMIIKKMKNCYNFLIFAQNIDCGYTLEPPH